ncbi:MAG: hypothetical protein QXP27_08775 [Candidatus Methanomethyliaceae archaeon]
MKVMLVASNDTQAKQFLSVAQRLPCTVSFLSLDACYGFNATPTLNLAKIYPIEPSWRGRKFNLATLPERFWMLWQVRVDIKNIFESVRPDCVVLGNDIGPIERIIIQYSKEKGIPTLLVQDGIILPEQPRLAVFKLRKIYRWMRDRIFQRLGLPALETPNYGGGGCDFVAAYDQFSYKIFLSRGYSPERVRITGQPRYDSWFTSPDVDIDTWRYKLQLPLGELIAIFPPTDHLVGLWNRVTLSSYVKALLQAVVRASHGRPIVLKLHPRDNLEYYEPLLQDIGFGQINIIRDLDAWIIIKLSSLVIVRDSTVGLEALLLDKPVFVADFSPYNDRILGLEVVGVFEHKAAIRFLDIKDLERGIEQFFTDVTMRNELQAARSSYRSCFPELIDSQASRRVAQFILEIGGLRRNRWHRA